MPFYRTSSEDFNRHFVRHHSNVQVTRQTYCNLCYPIPNDIQLDLAFQRFWYYLQLRHTARTYTYYTILSFGQLQEEINRGNTRFCLSIIYSINFAELVTDRHELAFLIARLYIDTNQFRQLPTLQQENNATLLYTAPRNNQNNPAPEMNQGNQAQLQAVLDAVLGQNGTLTNTLNNLFGPAGQNLTNFTNAINGINAGGGGPRELSLVKVEPFYGRDEDDPYDWIDHFNRAAAANRWADNRKVEIAAGFLREAARAWYEADRNNINQWHQNNNANNFDDRFLARFSPETKQNKWYYELMTIRQMADESVSEYTLRFRKLLRKVNAANPLPDRLQVRMYLYGLNPVYTPLVSIGNPGDLAAAEQRALTVETGHNYVPSKEMTMKVPTSVIQNPTLNTTTTATTQTGEIDALTQQLQQMSLNYATLTSALLAQNSGNKTVKFKKNSNASNNTDQRDSGYRKGNCFNCGKPGHYSRECPTGKKSPRPQRINYAEDEEYEYESELPSSEDEYEIYVQGLSESPKEKRTRKRVRTGEEMDENDQYITPPVIPPTATPKATPKRKPERKFHMKPAPIENVTEFDIAQYIKDLPCGLSIGQASSQIPKYRNAMLRSIRRKREANFASSKDNAPTTAARCMMKVDGRPIPVVIDSGAATSLMTKKLMKKLGYEIDRSSKLMVVAVNGLADRALGEIIDFPLEVKGIEFVHNIQVIDSADEILLLGNDWLSKVKANLDYESRIFTFCKGSKRISLPIQITRGSLPRVYEDSQDEYDSEEYEDEDDLEESPVYFSDFSDYSDTFEDIDDLEFNPWLNHTPDIEPELEETEEFDNPAVYLANVASKEEVPTLNLGPLDEHQQRLFQKLMMDHKDICARSQTEIGRTNIIKHSIDTGDARPIYQTPYNTNPKNKAFLKEEIAKMEANGIIRKSISPWASPVVIVDKKGGDKRICIDYRKLNAVTKPDAYPLPRIDNMLESFGQAKWFTTLDLASGYWQVAMKEKDIEKTAFTTPFGLYEFLVMPFGLSYAPGTFQRLMNRVLQDFLDDFVAVYLDDVIIYTKGSFEQHMDHLRQVFKALKEANLKIKLKKCHFALPNIHFLGHVVGQDGIRPDPEKIEKVKHFPVPTNLTQLRAALGLFSYYRKFIKDFSRIAKPMLTLLKKDAPFSWTEKQQNAFDRLKEMLVKAPILGYPDFEKPFIIYTDASGIGLGAVLSQVKEDGKEHVIAYASRSLSPAEKNYSVTDQECLAVVWAIKKFQHYLGLLPFTIITDHIALKWLQTSKMPSGRRARWVMELQQYDFSIKHRPGKTNANADALSRAPDKVFCFFADEYAADSEDNEEQIIYRPIYKKDCLDPKDIPLPFSASGSEISSTQWDIFDDDDESIDIQVDYEDVNGINTVAYNYSAQEVRDIFAANIKIKQVIAGQPITRGGSQCTLDCDIENHHVHCYCKACKRNLPYGTTCHNCVVGFTPGKIYPEMNPLYLINEPWWKEPQEVQKQDALRFFRNFLCLYKYLNHSTDSLLTPATLAADLD